ncbi:MAG TPA: DUF2914 domain-containing protein [Vicinamibacteria bacterium]|nr:DUF2914 domain-containing protein [Vicinamibacteria bacterium]
MTGSAKANAFGEQLRRAREAHGVTLAAVAEATRIPRRHLEALERSDLEALPSGPFAKGYIEAYTRFLGVDPRPILEAYRARDRQRHPGTPEDDRRLLDELSHLVERRGQAKSPVSARLKPAHIGLAALVLVLLAGLGWVVVRGRGRRPVTAAAARPPGATTAAPAGAKPHTSPPATASARPSPKPAVVPPTPALEVREHGVGTAVADHRLVGRSSRFAEGSTVVFWTAVVGGRAGQVIGHVWFENGRAVTRAELPIRGSLWRTQSRLQLPRGSAGPWAVEARASDGRLLARDTFLCEPAP